MVKPFRFGVQCGGDRDRADFEQLARKVEALGYATLYLPDHFIDTQMAPLVGMCIAAEATKSLRVGALVFDNDYKHPAILAKEIATLDRLSGGRVELGIGAGWMKVDYDALGIPYDPAGVRVDRLEEALAVIKGSWGPDAFSFSGEHYRIDGLDGEPKPVQRPHPPLVGGGGVPKILALAAKHAQIVGINANLRAGSGEHPDSVRSLTAAATDEKLATLRDAAGERFADLEIQTLTGFVHVTDDREGIAQGMATAFDVEPDVALETPAALVGTIDEMCVELEARRQRWQMSYVVVPEEFTDVFAPVVARLAGT
jgi:probable F420-dependent oxidoreductase